MSRCLVLLGLCFLLLPACRNVPKAIETSLYFGFSKPDGSMVADSAWQRFVREEVVPVFPQGFTIIPARGMWREKGSALAEHSAVIVSLNNMEPALSEKIDALRAHYKKAFSQQSVMRVDIEATRWDY